MLVRLHLGNPQNVHNLSIGCTEKAGTNTVLVVHSQNVLAADTRDQLPAFEVVVFGLIQPADVGTFEAGIDMLAAISRQRRCPPLQYYETYGYLPESLPAVLRRQPLRCEL